MNLQRRANVALRDVLIREEIEDRLLDPATGEHAPVVEVDEPAEPAQTAEESAKETTDEPSDSEDDPMKIPKGRRVQ